MQIKNNNPKVLLMKFYISIIVVLCIINGIIVFSYYTGNRMTTVYTPLIDATMEIKLEATTAHLWFEEIISGDRHEDIEQVWEHIKQADWYAQAMLEGGENQEGTFTPLNNNALIKEIIEVRNKIEEFKEITQKRYVTIDSAQAGSDIDEKYDAVFRDFILQVDEVKTKLQQIMRKDLSNYKRIQIGLIFFVIIITIILIVVFVYFERLRHKDYLSIININADLEKEVIERKQAEEILIESEEKYHNLIKSIPLPLCIVNTGGKYEYTNDLFTKIFGFTREEIPTLDDWWIKAYPDKQYRSWAMNSWNNTIDKARTNNSDIESAEYKVTCKDGNILTIIISGIIVDNGFLATFTDISEIKQSEAKIKNLNENLENLVKDRTNELSEKALKLQKSQQALTFLLEDVNDIKKQLEISNYKLLEVNKELESFSYSVSHDLRAPLRHINGYIDMLNRRFTDSLPEKGISIIGTIADSAKQMGELIDDLLLFSRTGRQEMRSSNIDMGLIFDKALNSTKAENDDRKISWTIKKLPHVYCDSSLLVQVWKNLLSNAIKFTSKNEKTKIEVEYEENEKEFVFCVKDNGIGFNMKYSKNLFGVFQRLHSKSDYEGTGIGLANVQRIIIRHGGRVWAEAEQEKGAAFFFTLPKINDK